MSKFPNLSIGLSLKAKVKVSPFQAMKALGDVDARVHIYTATAIGRGWLVLRSAVFTPILIT